MTPRNPDIADCGRAFAVKTREASQAKIAAAKARISDRMENAGRARPRMTIAAFLKEAGLNRFYLEGSGKRAEKQALKQWLGIIEKGGRASRAARSDPPGRRPVRVVASELREAAKRLRGRAVDPQ